MRILGYAWLRETLSLPVLPVSPVAVVGATTKIIETGETLYVPAAVAPEADTVLAHVYFALKHEGTNLGVLSQALRHLPAPDLVSEMHLRPNSRFARIACFLWEHYNRERLPDLPRISGPYVDVFDPDLYFVGDVVRDARYGVGADVNV
jgi:hypothetical protein